MRKSYLIISFILIFLLISNLVYSQDEPTLVRFKYHPGEILKYKLIGVGNGTVGLLSGNTIFNLFGFNTTIKADLMMEMYIHASTLSVSPEGTGQFQINLGNMDIRVGVLGQNFQLNFQDGIMQVYNNGKLVTEQSMDSITQMGWMDQTMQLTISNRGEMLDFSSPQWDQLKETPEISGFMTKYWKNQIRAFLPEQPLKPGDYWESTTKFEMPEFLNKPIQTIERYTVDTIREIKDEKCMVLKLKSDYDLSGLAFSFDKLGLPEAKEMKEMEMKFKTAEYYTTGQTIIGIESGKLIKSSMDQKLNIDFSMKLPPVNDENLNMDVQLKGIISFIMDLES